MSRRWTLALALGTLVLAAYLFGWEIPRERAAQERSEAELRLMAFDPAAADTLRILRDGRETVVARDDDGQWWMREPRVEKASELALTNQLGVLADSRSARLLEEDVPAEDLSRFGLGPSQRIRVRIASRQGWHRELFVGNLTPGEEFAYVQRPDRAGLELAEKSLYQIAWSRPSAYRDRRLFEVARDDIVRLQVHGPHGRWGAERDEQGLWWTPDRRARLDRDVLQGIAYDLSSARIRDFARDRVEEREWAAYGLVDPYASIAFVTREGEEHRVELGNEAEDQNVYARRDGGDSVLQLLPQLTSRAELDPALLLDTNPIVRNFTQLDSVQVRWEDGTQYRLRWIDGNWLVGMEGDWPGSDDERLIATRNVIEALEQFQVDDTMILAAGQAPEKVLDRLPITVRMWWGDEQVDLAVGWMGHGEHHWVRVDHEPQLLRTDRNLYLALRGFFLSARLLTP